MRRRWSLRGLVLGLALVGAGCRAVEDGLGRSGPSRDDEQGGEVIDALARGKADGLTVGPIFFDRACEPGRRITLAAVGDLLLHDSIQTMAEALADPEEPDAEARGAAAYRVFFGEIEGDLAEADLTLANLEVPLARNLNSAGKEQVLKEKDLYDGSVYSGWPMFNAHPSFARTVKSLGIDVVTTANNHALDRRSAGADATIAALDAVGLAHVGTVVKGETLDSAHRGVLLESHGIRIAVLAYTYDTNGLEDPYRQVSLLDRETILADVAAWRARPDVDLVIVAPHWGIEYMTAPTKAQRTLALEALEAGADAVIGGHPHVLQPMERHVTADGRETFVIYSLGNFFSGQVGTAKRSTVILYLGVTKPVAGRAFLNGVRYLPVYVNTVYDETYKRWLRKAVAVDRDKKLEHLRPFITNLMGGVTNLVQPDEPVVTARRPEAEGGCSEPRRTDAGAGMDGGRDGGVAAPEAGARDAGSRDVRRDAGAAKTPSPR
ncbi:MAG: CapA family protein [Deltaproteobacteria bacterium]|nr:CapA family protein [Deltaproteobacteria bacterium]